MISPVTTPFVVEMLLVQASIVFWSVFPPSHIRMNAAFGSTQRATIPMMPQMICKPSSQPTTFAYARTPPAFLAIAPINLKRSGLADGRWKVECGDGCAPSEGSQTDDGRDDGVSDGHCHWVCGHLYVMICEQCEKGGQDWDVFHVLLWFSMRAIMNTAAKKPAARVSSKENIKTPRRAGRQQRKCARPMSLSERWCWAVMIR